MENQKGGMDRRTFLRRAAATTAAAAWAAPLIQSVAASPAYAGTPVPCDWSGCVGACAASGDNASCGGPPGQVCQGPCTSICGGPGGDCGSSAPCDPGNWASCVYTG